MDNSNIHIYKWFQQTAFSFESNMTPTPLQLTTSILTCWSSKSLKVYQELYLQSALACPWKQLKTNGNSCDLWKSCIHSAICKMSLTSWQRGQTSCGLIYKMNNIQTVCEHFLLWVLRKSDHIFTVSSCVQDPCPLGNCITWGKITWVNWVSSSCSSAVVEQSLPVLQEADQTSRQW